MHRTNLIKRYTKVPDKCFLCVCREGPTCKYYTFEDEDEDITAYCNEMIDFMKENNLPCGGYKKVGKLREFYCRFIGN